MRYLAAAILCFSMSLFSQTILNTEHAFHDTIYQTIIKDSLTFVVTNKGIVVLKFHAPQKHDIVNSINFSKGKITATGISDNELLLFTKDSLYLFNRINNTGLELSKVYKSPSQYISDKIFPFGSYYIFRYHYPTNNDYSYKLIKIDTAITELSTIASNLSLTPHFPYIFIGGTTLKIVKFFSPDNYYIESSFRDSTFSLGPVLITGKTLLYTVSGYFPPDLGLNKLWLDSLPNHFVTSFHKISALYYPYPRQISATYFYHDKYIRSYINSAQVLYTCSSNEKVVLGENRFYVFDTLLYSGNKLISLNTKYIPMPQRGKLLATKDSTLHLMSNVNINNTFSVDSIPLKGAFYANDTSFFTVYGNKLGCYGIGNNKFALKWEIEGQFNNYDLFDLGDFFIKKNSTEYSLFRVSPYQHISSSSDYPNLYKVFRDQNFVYFVDTVKGITKFNLTQSGLVKKWDFTNTSDRVTASMQAGNLVVVKKDSIYLIDAASSEDYPIVSAKIKTPLWIKVLDAAAGDNHFYLNVSLINRRHLYKYSISDSIKFEYSVPLDNTNFTFIEGDRMIHAFSKSTNYWISDPTVTGVSNEEMSMDFSFKLKQNYPNPFNPSTIISFTIPEETKVSMRVYDILGREVAVLVDDIMSAGSYNIPFNGDEYRLTSGIYFCRIWSKSGTEVIKMMLVK